MDTETVFFFAPKLHQHVRHHSLNILFFSSVWQKCDHMDLTAIHQALSQSVKIIEPGSCGFLKLINHAVLKFANSTSSSNLFRESKKM